MIVEIDRHILKEIIDNDIKIKHELELAEKHYLLARNIQERNRALYGYLIPKVMEVSNERTITK